MTTPQGRQRPAGLVVGSTVALVFGTVFVFANSGGLDAPWPLVIRALAVLVALLLVAALVVTVHSGASATGESPGDPIDRRYWLIVALEGVALFGGLAVINGVLHRSAVAVAWVALVVGVHFFGLARIWHLPLFHWLGAVMTVLGLAGFLISALGGTAPTVALVAGVGSGAALYAAVAVAVAGALRGQRPDAP